MAKTLTVSEKTTEQSTNGSIQHVKRESKRHDRAAFSKRLNKYKDRNTGFANFLRFMYAVGSFTLFHSIVIAICGILIPIFFDASKYVLFGCSVFILVLDIVFDYVCSSYSKQRFQDRRFSELVISNISSLINSINIEIGSNPLWKKSIFKKTSELACEKIRTAFKAILDCDTRVSVEYTFEKKNANGKVETFVHMSGRRSKNREICKKPVLLNKKRQYFSYQIFNNGDQKIYLLSNEDTHDPQTWFRNHDTPEVNQYIGIAVCVADNKVAFILQIDCLEDVRFGKTNDNNDIKDFINKNLKPYINMITQAYLLSIGGNKPIREVN